MPASQSGPSARLPSTRLTVHLFIPRPARQSRSRHYTPCAMRQVGGATLLPIGNVPHRGQPPVPRGPTPLTNSVACDADDTDATVDYLRSPKTRRKSDRRIFLSSSSTCRWIRWQGLTSGTGSASTGADSFAGHLWSYPSVDQWLIPIPFRGRGNPFPKKTLSKYPNWRRPVCM